MAFSLPLHILDSIYRCCGIMPSTSPTPVNHAPIAERVIRSASLFDVIRWRRVSKTFREAADARLSEYTRVEVRMYNGIAELHKKSFDKDVYEWHPHANVALVELGPTELGIGIDTKMKTKDARALVQLLSTFRHSIRHLFIDSPIVEMLVSMINRQQINVLLSLLLRNRSCASSGASTPSGSSGDECCVTPRSSASGASAACGESLVSVVPPEALTDGPFFPRLKSLTITTQSNQLEHLSRLLNYAISVDFLYETNRIDLLCLKICMGASSQWCQKPHMRFFRQVTRFRQWTEANKLGHRYCQHFYGNNNKAKKCTAANSTTKHTSN